jgi:uncharacterized protein with HEPN domain
MPRDDERLLDMLVAARRASKKVANTSHEEFMDDDDLQLAVVYLIQAIGEAARGVSTETQREHPEVPWHEIIGMRNRLVHDYLNVDVGKVWQTATKDLPQLIATIEPLVPPETP